jgi:copper chaperone CopZ
LRTWIFSLLPILFAASLPVSGQVEKIAMRTTGVSCGICAGLSEVYFHRLPGIDQVKISLRNEAIMLTYKPGAKFDPEAIRKVLEPLEVGILQFQIGARGDIRESEGKQFLQAGKDRFLIRHTTDSPTLPVGTLLRIEGVLFDHATPMEVKVLTFQRLP